ncbi:glycerate kinase type-2 family protein [Methylobacterium radiodurans]|uniref:Glycerate kinase n=1 Tax=Methylobacterium radiodurans TaxID=2202828 RepID=A0A2U8VND8_9HYPH|nr:glycerate kinase [Methylobacterium radiodurans]AWN35070.1 glycerate kinase [Methylobacterium radiodurans]
MTIDAAGLLSRMFAAAVDAAAPAIRIPPNLPPAPLGRTVVIGAGKASAAMAAAVDANWQGPLDGLVVTRYGHAVPAGRISIVEAAHPVPDEAGLRAAEAILDKVQGLGPDDLVLCLISGGGSSLLSLPAPGISLADKQAVNRALLSCGAPISEMNVVRKHLSALKGGRLAAAAAPARVVTLVISDVPGDDVSLVASGPTVPDPSTRHQARAILDRYRIDAPRSVLEHLARPESETPKPGDPCFAGSLAKLVATPQRSLEAAARVARDAGITPLILGSAIEGEAREVGIVHAGIALQCAGYGEPLELPCVLISGGETTVTVRERGRGGRNAEFLLGLGLALDGHPGIAAIAADTDGIDGTESNAGAVLKPDTLARAAALGIDAEASLRANDAYGVFDAVGDLVVTGPTLTNVNDFRAVFVFGRS